MELRRIHPAHIQDMHYLSRLLDFLLSELERSPLHLTPKALSYEVQMPETILERLRNLHRQPEEAAYIRLEDYHAIFPQLLLLCPTVQMFELPDGSFFVKI